MKSRLKNLYTYLIVNRKHQVDGWHSAYCEFYAEVEKNRERIQSGEKLSQNNEEFLKKLLYDKSNGIASRGQSVLSHDQFQAFIKNTDFLTALESAELLEFLRVPSQKACVTYDGNLGYREWIPYPCRALIKDQETHLNKFHLYSMKTPKKSDSVLNSHHFFVTQSDLLTQHITT